MTPTTPIAETLRALCRLGHVRFYTLPDELFVCSVDRLHSTEIGSNSARSIDSGYGATPEIAAAMYLRNVLANPAIIIMGSTPASNREYVILAGHLLQLTAPKAPVDSEVL